MIVSVPLDQDWSQPLDFHDITASEVVGVHLVGSGRRRIEVTFVDDLTPTETAAVKARLLSASVAEETLRTDIAAFDPTTADLPAVIAQLDRLSRLVNDRSDEGPL